MTDEQFNLEQVADKVDQPVDHVRWALVSLRIEPAGTDEDKPFYDQAAVARIRQAFDRPPYRRPWEKRLNSRPPHFAGA